MFLIHIRVDLRQEDLKINLSVNWFIISSSYIFSIYYHYLFVYNAYNDTI